MDGPLEVEERILVTVAHETTVCELRIYIAHNMLRLDFGSMPNFGGVTAVFNASYVRDMVLIAPWLGKHSLERQDQSSFQMTFISHAVADLVKTNICLALSNPATKA